MFVCVFVCVCARVCVRVRVTKHSRGVMHPQLSSQMLAFTTYLGRCSPALAALGLAAAAAQAAALVGQGLRGLPQRAARSEFVPEFASASQLAATTRHAAGRWVLGGGAQRLPCVVMVASGGLLVAAHLLGVFVGIFQRLRQHVLLADYAAHRVSTVCVCVCVCVCV